MAGIRLEWAQFGDFDSFDVIRSDTSMANVADVDLPSAIAANLKTMYYVDTTVTQGNTYYYKVRVWRDDVGVVSSEVECVADRDEYWGNVTALLHFNGNLTDETGLGVYSKTAGVTFTTEHAFDGQAIRIQNTTDNVSTSGISTWQFGGNDFCIEFFLYIDSIVSSSTTALVTKWDSGTRSLCEFFLYIDIGKLQFDVRKNDGSTYVQIIECEQPPINQLVHIALSRSGNTFRAFYDGVKKVEQTSNVIINAANSTPVRIGGNPQLNWKLDGYIDELRVTKGVARYIEDFTPPVKPFPNQ